MSKNKSKIVKWEYVTEPFDVMVLPALFTRLHSPLTPWLSSLTENCYVHLRPCVQGVDEDGAVVKYLYCTRDGRFFTRGKDGWNEILVSNHTHIRHNKAVGGSAGCPQLQHHGQKYAHRCVAFAWLDVPKDVKLQMIGVDANGVHNTNQQSVCGGEEPRHTSPLCRPAASDATMLPKAEKWEVDHLNTDHKNWTADNLQWVTADENRRRGAIARRMRKIGLDPRFLTPTLCRGIYTLPEDMIEPFISTCSEIFDKDPSPLSAEAIRLDVAQVLEILKQNNYHEHK